MSSQSMYILWKAVRLYRFIPRAAQGMEGYRQTVGCIFVCVSAEKGGSAGEASEEAHGAISEG